MNKIENHLITFCGVFSFTQDDLVNKYSANKFANCFTTENNDLEYFRSQYYSNYTNIIISRRCSDSQTTIDTLEHKVVNDISSLGALQLQVKETDIKFTITNADLFFFPEILRVDTQEKLGIYSLTVKIIEKEITTEMITNFLNKMRLFNHRTIKLNDELLSTLELVEKYIIYQKVSDKYISDIIGNKLKTFSVISLQKYPTETVDELLYDIGTSSEIGSAKGNGLWAPSESYYLQLIENNTISCFSNWKAIALFDSFTVIGSNLKIESQWRKNYFFIYITCLKQKFYMFRTNLELSDITQIKRNSAKIRNTFIEFINDNILSQISFNFLPNIIYSKMQYALDIKQEVEELEAKISRITMLVQEKQQSRLNNLLLLITFIGMSSAIWDTSEYLKNILRLPDNIFYPIWGISVFLVISILVVVFFNILKRKK